MDIHRCRFVPYPPQAINSLAFSRPSNERDLCPSDQRLAIGRSNGDIELWNPAKGFWSQEAVFPGGRDRSIEALVWTEDFSEEDDSAEIHQHGKLRLFSIGNSSSVTEWDLARGVPARHAQGNFGVLWCLAAQPNTRQHANKLGDRPLKRKEQYLAAGCEDGTVILFSTEDQDLRYYTAIGIPPTKKPNALSITWRDPNTLVVGYSDSAIRVYDIRSKQTLRTMSLGKPATGGNETVVWAVKCLQKGTILSGDSSGELKIWDGESYSLVQRLHCHQADILDISTNSRGTIIFTGGADRRTVTYHQVPSGKGGTSQRWAETMHRRFHEHDVKTLASFESRDLSVVVSGGPDTVPVLIPFRKMQKEYHRALPHLPRRPQIASAPGPRLLISWWDQQVNIWHLDQQATSREDSQPRDFWQNHTLLAELRLSGDESITNAHISIDGRLLAVATLSCVKMFTLVDRATNGKSRLRTKKLDVPPILDEYGSNLVVFSSDSRWLCCSGLDNQLLLMSITTGDSYKSTPQIRKVAELHRTPPKTAYSGLDSGLGKYKERVNNISFSGDSQTLAVGDISGRISIWTLQGPSIRKDQPMKVPATSNGTSASDDASSNASSEEDSSDDESPSDGVRWRKHPIAADLPKLDSPLLTMSFRPRFSSSQQTSLQNGRASVDEHERLVAITAGHRIVEYTVHQGCLSDWTRRNPSSYLPAEFRRVRERAMGMLWDTSLHHDRLWLYGSTWMFMVDMAQDLPLVSTSATEDSQYPLYAQQSQSQKKKRKREDLDAEELRKKGSGAGGPMPLSKSSTSIGPKVRKFESTDSETVQVIELDRLVHTISDDDLRPEEDTGLAELRRSQTQNPGGQQRGGVDSDQVVDGHASVATQAPSHEPVTRPTSHLLLKYRSILGIVPIDGRVEVGDDSMDVDEGTTGRNTTCEIAIVERPLWDVDLPPRLEGGQDWDA